MGTRENSILPGKTKEVYTMEKTVKAANIILTIVAASFAVFSIVLPLVNLNIMQARGAHLAFVFTLINLNEFFLKSKKKSFWQLALLILVTVVEVYACLYIVKEARSLLLFRIGAYNKTDLIMGSIVFIGVLICTYKLYGRALTGIIIFFLLYMIFGKYLPHSIGHPGVSFKRVIGNICLGTEGIFGSPLGAATSTVAIFVIFASFLELSGGFQLFMDLAMLFFRRVIGGPAKIAVISSSLFGCISGSAAANVAATGSITIPMMKRNGYESHVAGAVEAAASSGGQLMPPIMGAAAFVMAEMLGVAYSKIMIAGIVPAICYYIAIFMSVDLYSRKNHLGIMRKEDEKQYTREEYIDLAKRSLLLIPLILMFVFVGIFQWSGAKSALLSTLAVIVCAFPYKENRFTLKKILLGLRTGGLGILAITIVCAASGVIIGVFTVTGLGLKLSSAIVSLANGRLFAILLLAMVASLILGMGVPTVAAYLILSILVAPSLIKFGIPAIAAHMFVFYFGIISAITPPVAMAAYVAAGLAGAPPVKVGLTACRFALPAFIVPFILVYNPALILQGGTLLQTMQVVLTTLIGCFFCSMAMQRYFIRNLNWVETIILGVAAICVMIPETITDYIGFASAMVVIVPLLIHTIRTRKAAQVVN